MKRSYQGPIISAIISILTFWSSHLHFSPFIKTKTKSGLHTVFLNILGMFHYCKPICFIYSFSFFGFLIKCYFLERLSLAILSRTWVSILSIFLQNYPLLGCSNIKMGRILYMANPGSILVPHMFPPVCQEWALSSELGFSPEHHWEWAPSPQKNTNNKIFRKMTKM